MPLPAAELLTLLLPLLIVAAGALVVLVLEPFLAGASKHRILPWIGGTFLAAAGVALYFTGRGHLHGILALDLARSCLLAALLGTAAAGLAGLQQSLGRDKYPGGESYALMLLATAGAMLMTMAVDAIALFVALELTSLPIYALVGLRRSSRVSNEAIFKYFVMGSAFSAIFLFGAAWVYGATGTTHFGGIPTAGGDVALYAAGLAMMILGLLFKVGVVPFHAWSPDAYTGAPVAVTGFMAGAVKIGGFAALGSLWLSAVAGLSGMRFDAPLDLTAAIAPVVANPLYARFAMLFLVLGLLSILLGNLGGLRQTSTRRMMAFSSVAHAGYMLLALGIPQTAGQPMRLNALWFYLAIYALASAGTLAALASISGAGDEGDDIQSLRGAARRHPLLGFALTVFLAAMAGIPPTAGFMGKFFIFSDLVRGGFVFLTLFAMVLAVVGAAYYFRLIVVLWGEPPALAAASDEVRPLNGLVLGALGLSMIAFGILPNWPTPPAPAAAIASRVRTEPVEIPVPAHASHENEADTSHHAAHGVMPVSLVPSEAMDDAAHDAAVPGGTAEADGQPE